MKNDKLRVESPCEKRWDDLEGEGRKRHCDACSLHVIDGSALTKEAAEAVVTDAASTGERVCMRMLVDESGHFVHAQPVPERSESSVWKAGALFAAGALASCGESADAPKDPGLTPPGEVIEAPTTEPPSTRPPEILGEICYVGGPDGDEPDSEKAEQELTPRESPEFTKEELREMMGGMRVLPEPPVDPGERSPD